MSDLGNLPEAQEYTRSLKLLTVARRENLLKEQKEIKALLKAWRKEKSKMRLKHNKKKRNTAFVYEAL